MSSIPDLELKEVSDGTLVVYRNQRIAKITEDGVVLVDVTEVRRNAVVFEWLKISRASLLIEKQEHLENLFEWKWRQLEELRTLTINCYFTFQVKWLISVLKEACPQLKGMQEFHVYCPQPISEEQFKEIAAVLPNMICIRVVDGLGNSFRQGPS